MAQVRRHRDNFAHKLDNKLTAFEDSEHGKFGIGNNRLLGTASPTAYKAERRGLVVNPVTSQKCS